MITKINRKITTYYRIKEFLESYSNLKIKSDKDKRTIYELRIILDKKIEALQNLNKSLLILYILLYFSVINMALPDFLILTEFKKAINMVISIFGTGIFLALVLIINKTKEILYTDIMMIAMAIISIYSKYTDEEIYKNNIIESIKYMFNNN